MMSEKCFKIPLKILLDLILSLQSHSLMTAFWQFHLKLIS